PAPKAPIHSLASSSAERLVLSSIRASLKVEASLLGLSDIMAGPGTTARTTTPGGISFWRGPSPLALPNVQVFPLGFPAGQNGPLENAQDERCQTQIDRSWTKSKRPSAPV